VIDEPAILGGGGAHEETIPQIPLLDIKSYGDQETFLAMLEVTVNALVTIVNALLVAEMKREKAAEPKIILTTTPSPYDLSRRRR
jgi:hypothetical protein